MSLLAEDGLRQRAPCSERTARRRGERRQAGAQHRRSGRRAMSAWIPSAPRRAGRSARRREAGRISSRT